MNLFVYGTLMRGETNHDAIRQHDPEETLRGHARGRLHATAADYPMLDVHEHDERDVVHGEFMRFTRRRRDFQRLRKRWQ